MKQIKDWILDRIFLTVFGVCLILLGLISPKVTLMVVKSFLDSSGY